MTSAEWQWRGRKGGFGWVLEGEQVADTESEQLLLVTLVDEKLFRNALAK